jgi:hypothetical protein
VSSIFKKQLVQAIAIVVALVMFGDFFLGTPELKAGAGTLQNWVVIISNMALGLGAINLLHSNTESVVRKDKVWPFSAWLIVLFGSLLGLGLSGYIIKGDPLTNSLYSWAMNNVYISLGETLYAITAFFVFSAAYRAFRARTLDAFVLLAAGILVMLKNAPVGEAIWSGFPVIGNWLIITGQLPSMRTFIIVGALGLIAYGFRALLGKEPGFYGGIKE